MAFSAALFEVARMHVRDLVAHPELVTGSCDARSWSGDSTLWQGCCYTGDAASAECMWSKPREITASWGQYQYATSGIEQVSRVATTARPETVIDQWVRNSLVADFLLNRGSTWEIAPFNPWQAMGCWLEGGYASVWMGTEPDPQTYRP